MTTKKHTVSLLTEATKEISKQGALSTVLNRLMMEDISKRTINTKEAIEAALKSYKAKELTYIDTFKALTVLVNDNTALYVDDAIRELIVLHSNNK